MLRLALALFLGFSVPAAAVDACLALDLIEVRATLRGPGVVVGFHPKTPPDHVSACFFARLSESGSSAENLRRFQSEAPPTLTVTVADNLGSKGFDLLKAQPDSTDSQISGIGDRAVLRRAPTGERLAVASGSTFLLLGLEHDRARGSHQDDLIALAKEALAANFDRSRTVKHEIADRVVASDKGAFETDPKNFAVFLMALRRFDDARAYNLRAAAVNPDDPDVLYLQGVLDWKMSYPARMETRARLMLAPVQPLAGSACAEIRGTNRERVEEGIVALLKAIKLRSDFTDAMMFLSLTYRERSDYQCDDGAARTADLKSADDWAGKSNAARVANSGKGDGENVLSEYFFPFPPPPPPPPPPTNASHGSPVGGVIGSVNNSTPSAIPGFAPEAVPEFAMSQRVRLPVGAAQQLWLGGPQPAYPPLARQARIQGTVVLKGVIGKDGSIETLKIGSGHPFLAPAAIDAVKQWKYRPYLLNGNPVEVDTEIWVNFALSATDPPPSSTSATLSSQMDGVAGSVTNALHANGVTVGASQHDQGPATKVASSVKKSNLVRNTAPEEMWSRLTQCVFPANALVAGNSYTEGTVDLGFVVSRDGNVVDVGVRGGDSSLRTLAIRAIRQWKFRPDTGQDVTTFSRVRAFVRFNADGTSSVDLARASAPDDFGDPGNATADSSHADSNILVVPRPLSAPQCKSQVPWISAREVN